MSPLTRRAERAMATLLLTAASLALAGGCLLNRAGIGSGGAGGQGGAEDQGGAGGDGGMSSAGGQAMGGSPPCGNGTLDEGEACDDGNTDDGDGCSALCTFDASDTCPPNSQIPLLPGVEVQQIGTTFGADNSIDPACSDQLRPDVAYEVVPAENGTLQVLLTGSFDRVLYIRDGCPAVDLKCEELTGGVNTTVRLQVLGNKPYLVMVDADVQDSATTFGLSMVLLNCGDGILDTSEECDDGNHDNGDGCSDACVVECEGGIKRSDHHCYRFFTEDVTWNVARTNCLALGPNYDLVGISSSSERNFIDDVVDPPTSMWTGGNDQVEEGNYVWSNGEPFDFIGWDDDEPNGGNNENCIEYREKNFSSNDRFNDLGCDATLDYLCELTPAGS